MGQAYNVERSESTSKANLSICSMRCQEFDDLVVPFLTRNIEWSRSRAAWR